MNASMLAALLAVIVVASIAPMAVRNLSQGMESVRAHAVASQGYQISEAADAYTKANYSAILTATGGVGGAVTLPLSALISTGYLPASFNASDVYGQTWQVSFYQPAANDIDVLLNTTGGIAARQVTLPQIAAQMGERGGFQPAAGAGPYSSDAGDAVGSYGGWLVPVSAFGLAAQPGSPTALLYYNSGTLSSTYLYRVAVPGNPQVNTMQTALNMGANDLNNAQDVNVNHNIVAGTPGSCVIDADGHCTGEISAAGTTETDLPANWWGGITTDDLHARGTVAVGPPGAYQANINDFALGSASTGGAGYFSSPNGANDVSIIAPHGGPAEVQTNGILSGQVLYPGTNNGQANIGWGCGPNGAISGNANGTGQTLSCVNGTWQTPAFSPYEAASYYFAWNTEGTFNIWTTTIGPFALCAVEGQGGNYPSISLNISGGSPGAYYWYFYANGGGNYWGATVACFD